jgi:zinc protease
MLRPRFSLLVAVLMASYLVMPCGSATAEPAEIAKLATIEGITEYRLENGLKVLLFPDPTKPTVTVNLTIFVGSRHEGYGEAGMAHLLEHMLFKGTPTHPNVPKELKTRGAQYNGTTWVDRTNYYETLPAGKENLEFAIRLEADRMVNSFIKGEDLASEMSVVRNEFERGENSPAYVLDQRMMAVAYEWHNYGQATIGNRADIERVPVENLRVFYEKYYRPDNAMLVVAGRFETENALNAVRRYFGPLKNPSHPLASTYTEEPPQDGERFVTLRRVGDVAVAGVMYHIPSGAHPDYASIDVLESILTSEPTGRLYKALVESKKAASVNGAAYAWHDPAVLRLMAEISTGNDPQVVLEAMLDVLGRVAEEGVTDEDVERAKRSLLKQRELRATNSGRTAIRLSEWASQGDWRLYFLYRDRIEQVTVESVARVAADYLTPNNRTVGLFIPTEVPERVSVPATPLLAEMIGDYKGRAAVTAGEAFDVSPSNIEAHTLRRTLPGGVKVTLLQKRTRGEAVNLQLTLRYGNEQSLRGLTTASEYLPVIMTRGTKNFSRQELKDELDKNQATLSAEGSAGEVTFSILTKRPNFPAALALLRQVLREPTLPDAELEILKREQIAALEQRRKEPTALASLRVRRTMYPYEKGDPRYIPTIAEEIQMVKRLRVADLERIYASFLSARHGELAIVGDFDSTETMALVTEMLADWDATERYKRLKYYVLPGVTGGSDEIRTPGKANAMYFAAMAFPMRDIHPDYPALVLGNFILGGGGLSSRLADRVRQQEGLSYGIRSGLDARALDPRAAFYVYAISNPANMGRVKLAIREEIDRLLKDGISPDELNTTKQGYLQSLQVSRTSDGRLAGTLARTSFADRTMAYYEEFENRIAELTAEQILAALQKYIDPDELIIVTAGDFQDEPSSGGK